MSYLKADKYAGPGAVPFLRNAGGSRTGYSTLIITGRDHHDWQSTTPHLRKLLTDTGRFAVRAEEEPAGITPATLAKYDVVILHYNGPRWGTLPRRQCWIMRDPAKA
jgi:hypothetical protein